MRQSANAAMSKKPPLLDIPPDPKPARDSEPYTSKEVRTFLSLWWGGKSERDITKKMRRSAQGIKCKVWKLISNYQLGASDQDYNLKGYIDSRAGARWSLRERKALAEFRRKRISLDYVSQVLGRPVKEVRAYYKANKSALRSMLPELERDERIRKDSKDLKLTTMTTTDEDILLAHRFLYYVKKQPVLSDTEYDQVEHEILEYSSVPIDSLCRHPGSDNAADYPPHIEALAIYFLLRYAKRT